MKESFELYKHIYQDANMSCYTLKKLMEDLKEKDNKIKDLLEDIYKGYQVYQKDSRKFLQKNNVELEENTFMEKMMANMGIKKEVMSDNSDSAIADLLIQGVSMGSINMEKKIKNYANEVETEELQYAKDFLKFQEDSIEQLKAFL